MWAYQAVQLMKDLEQGNIACADILGNVQEVVFLGSVQAMKSLWRDFDCML